MNRLAPLVFTSLVLAGCGGGSSTALKTFHLPYKAGTIQLPGNWRFRDGGAVGDHSTWFWYDPNDAFAKLRVIASGCGGCVSTNNGVTPYPRGELPQFATVTAAPDAYTLAYQVYDTPYPDDGMVVVLHKASTIEGSIIVDLWLPTKLNAEAAQILASFQSGPG